jgi:hypothetical protein
MAVTRDGFPVRHWVFPGNTVDVTTIAKVKEDLRGWQLTRCLFVGEGERRRRYAVCFNPLEAKRQKSHREELLGELETELASLSDLAKVNHTKRVCALRTSARYGRLLKETKQGLAIDRQAITELERFDGKFKTALPKRLSLIFKSRGRWRRYSQRNDICG